MTAIKFLLVAVIGYVLGNFSTGIVLSHRMAKIDIREHGSKSAGTTNMFRVLGARASALTLIGDTLKGVLASLIGLWLLGREGAMLGGVMAVAGHLWPIFYGFKGGKGVATALGTAFVIQPLAALALLLITLAAIGIWRIVSIATISALAIYAAYNWIFSWGDWAMCLYATALAALVIFAHRSNLVRIFNGTEKNNRLDFSKKHKTAS